MCLLFALTDTSHVPKDKLSMLMLIINSEFKRTQQDGFGFAITLRDNPERYIERYVDPNDFIGVGRLPSVIKEAGWLGKYASFSDWHQHGDWDSSVPSGPMIVHGRTSTGSVQLKNTHPFAKNGWVLAHNGIVDWHGVKLPLETTCDSEHLLNCYCQLDGPKSFAENLTGYFATLAISPKGNLHVAKCWETELHFAWSSTWKTYILTTKSAFLSQVAQVMDLNITRPLPLEPYTEVIFHGNDCGGTDFFKPPSRVKHQAAKASKALGRAVSVKDDAPKSRRKAKKQRGNKVHENDELFEKQYAMDTADEGDGRTIENRFELLEELANIGVDVGNAADLSTDELKDIYESITSLADPSEQDEAIEQLNHELA